MLPVLFLTLLSWVAGMNAECTSADCPVRPRSSSLLQVKVKRNQGALGDASPEDLVQTHTPDMLLQTVQRMAEDRVQTAVNAGNESGDSDQGGDSDAPKWENPETILQAIEGHIMQTLAPDIEKGRAEDQKLLEATHKQLLDCARVLSAEEEAAGVGLRHADHETCRQQQAADYIDQRDKCRVRDEYTETLGEVPASPNGNDFPTLVERWREYFAVAVPLVEERYVRFKEVDEACLTAVTVWEDRKKLCKGKQRAYEAVVCETQEHRQGDVGDCIAEKVPMYNGTIQLLVEKEAERLADYTSAKRILCYIEAMGKDEGFADATHDCHSLAVETEKVRLSYPGWPDSTQIDAGRMYPCGKVWLSYSYGTLPFYAPHDKCTKCPNLPDLDGVGSVFTRWGSLSCPEPSSLIYKGFAGGSHTGHSGGGANFLCLVEDPTDAPDTTTGNENHAIIYGVQYRDNYAGTNNNNGDVGCSQCAYNGAIYTMWGSTECRSGHVEIYTGNVMASHHGHKRNEHICVDKERRTHSQSNDGDQTSALLYLAEYECGSLPCGPFDTNKEVACAVCGIPDTTADVYTRWGHDECTDGSSLVYSGVVGGSHYGHTGGGYNSMCLTFEPTDAPDTGAGNQNHASVYGTEYEGSYVGKSVTNHDAACAVCAYSGKSAYNIWGTTECPAGHAQLYKGNVWGDHHGHQRGEWVCVDPERKAHPKSDSGDQNGQLWYMAEYECGSLPCGGDAFNTNAEVACAVCGIPEGFGDVFTRWGHLECPERSDKIYSGVVGTGAHNRAGGGANPLCLVEKPGQAPDTNTGNNNHAMLYGAEYQSLYVSGVGGRNDWDVGCAVCAYKGLAAYESWGSVNCPDGYDKLYHGNVMAGHHGHPKENYVCVDPEKQQHYKGSTGNQDGGLWYLAEYECGSLPCSVYDYRKEAACAVCGIPGLESSGVTMRCDGYGTKESCPRGLCTWLGHTCKTACLEFRSNTSCPADCAWDDDQALCQEHCSDFTTLDQCPPGRCWWRGTECTSFTDDVDADGYVLLLKDFEYFGEKTPDLVDPRKIGSFDGLKAVYKSGPGIKCSSSASNGRLWQRCSNGNDNVWSFEFQKNSGYVVEQANYHTLPSECTKPMEPTGDIICDVDFTLGRGDRVLASWYEPTHQTSLGDNGGSIIVDIYGRRVRN